MEEWYCFQCKEKMVEKDVETRYLQILQYVPGLKCPKCGVPYLTEEIAVETVTKGEETIDAKMG